MQVDLIFMSVTQIIIQRCSVMLWVTLFLIGLQPCNPSLKDAPQLLLAEVH